MYGDVPKLVDPQDIDRCLNLVRQNLRDYAFDKYLFFPSKNSGAWQEYFIIRLDRALHGKEQYSFVKVHDGVPFLLCFNVTSWDEQVFGFKIANCSLNFLPDTPDAADVITELLTSAIWDLREKKVSFINLRLHGDNLKAIHALEDLGFRYIETIVWPYAESRSIPIVGAEIVSRLCTAQDLPRIRFIAGEYQYHRGHYYCDERFAPQDVNKMHVRWLDSYWEKGNPIVVVIHHGEIAGYIVLRSADADLQNLFGFKVGQLSTMALDPAFRGIGLGKNLIRGGMNSLHELGMELVDTGLATKNLFSSASIRVADFRNYYEEITMHLWL